LDGLKFNPPPLGLAAHEALAYLNESLSSKKIKIQTSKGNYLTDISFSEEFDFGNGEDKKKNLDDLILGICLWYSHDKSDEENTNNDHKNEVVVLLTNDRNLRVKARARGVDVVGMRDFTGLI
jgi:protein SMG6